tara:strand:+ start:8654 stop:8920 length:267 start_codon:yes stop_codon:yes gene_type:complete
MNRYKLTVDVFDLKADSLDEAHKLAKKRIEKEPALQSFCIINIKTRIKSWGHEDVPWCLTATLEVLCNHKPDVARAIFETMNPQNPQE